jgi:hypothetical protein
MKNQNLEIFIFKLGTNKIWNRISIQDVSKKLVKIENHNNLKFNINPLNKFTNETLELTALLLGQ